MVEVNQQEADILGFGQRIGDFTLISLDVSAVC